MNKYNLRDFIKISFGEYKSTLRDTSLDSHNGVYMCNDTATPNVYNFDEYVKDNFCSSKLPASPDAIYIGDKKLYFIEFKNQIPSAIDSLEIKTKFEKGTNILKEILNAFIPRDVEYIFCVVHKNTASRYFNPTHIESNIIRFGLKEKNTELGNFYNNIITEDVEYYKSKFIGLVC